jgi:putative molybdopterin biosynthesis protein
MEDIRRIQQLGALKILADEQRLKLLQLLMVKPETLSTLGKAVSAHPAQVRHHLKQLEQAGFVELVETRLVRGFVEKYYRATARAFYLQEMVLPDPGRNDRRAVIAFGSHDLALELLGQRLAPRFELLNLPVGSLEGLVALRQGVAQLAGCHLLDAESGEYNLPYVRHFFPERLPMLITLAHREQGLLVRPGNPRQVHGLDDLAREDITLVNRNPGSGTRIWLDRQLARMGVATERLRGYTFEVRTHTAVAEAIQSGQAEVGLGLEAAARRAGLDFIPLFQERYDLIMPQEQAQNHNLLPFLEAMQTKEYRRQVTSLGGYDTTHTGEQPG